MKLKYFSHSAFQISTEKNISILIDPFFEGNPNSPVKESEVSADYIILTHAHGDHIGDSFKIAKRCNSTFICVNELANYCASKGFKAHNMHIGGSHNFDFGKVKFTIAHHGSVTPDGVYGGEAAGVLLFIENKILYHCGDTGLFYDMKLIGEMNPVDYMLVPIGDNFTMGIDDAVKAVQLVNPATVIPMHYNTFPVISADPYEFKKKIEATGKKCIILNYNQEIEL
ncbi:metal-dependent hydrolase [Melioribacteraceae bacterium 4301-Me]|uniref:metal-dependent hydrolase n=1 Tax=Pyranulibacter aquaticus TaxID=3163344 RepID=UPI0035997914